MAGPINYEFFKPFEGQNFKTQAQDGSPTDLFLKRIEKRENGPSGFEFFSLLFDGPLEPRLEQATYVLHKDGVDELPVFLVPVAGDDQGFQYEAVYNIRLG